MDDRTVAGAPVGNAAIANMKANFGLAKYILLSLITLGIYGLWTYAKMGSNLDIIAGRYDGKKTMNYWLLALLIGPITFGIGYLVWNHKFADRLGTEINRRGLPNTVSAGSYWLWGVLGTLIVVGPFVYFHKLAKAMNGLIEDAQRRGC